MSNNYGLHKDDVRDIEDSLLEQLDNSRSALAEDVSDLVANNNKARDTYLSVGLMIAAVAVEELADKRIDAFNSDRDFNKVIGAGMTHAVAVVAMDDRKLSADLSNNEFDQCKELADQVDDIAQDMKGGRRDRDRDRGRDNRRDRGRGRDGRRDDRREDKRRDRDGDRDRGRDRKRNRDRDDRGSRGEERAAGSTYKRRDADAAREERNSNRHAEREQYVEEEIPEIVLASESTQVPEVAAGQFPSQIYNAMTSSIYHVRNNDGTVNEVVREKGAAMEDYDEHELIGNPFNRAVDSDTRTIPAVDYGSLSDISILPQAPDTTYLKQVLYTVGNGYVPNLTQYNEELYGQKNTTVANVVQHSLMAFPTEHADLLSKVSTFRTFSEWHNLMCDLRDKITDDSVTSALTIAFLTKLDIELTELFNICLAMSISSNTSVSSFFDGFSPATAWLNESSQRMEMDIFRDVAGKTLGNGIAKINEEAAAELVASGKIHATVDTEKVTFLWFRSNYLYVTLYGELLTETLQFSKKHAIASVSYDAVPGFYELCSNVLRLRNSTHPGSAVIIADAFGTNVQLVAPPSAGAAIRAKRLS